MRIVKRRLCRQIAYCDHNISDLFTFRQIGREKREREREYTYTSFFVFSSPDQSLNKECFFIHRIELYQ